MKTLLVGAGSGLALTAGASPAMAQDASFTGFHVELVTGYDNEGIDFDDDVFGGGKNSQNGWLYGLGLGYDYQTESGWVFGAEGELTDSTASRNETLSGVRPANPIAGVPARPVATNVEFNADADFYIGARVGYVVAPQFLLYAKAGYTHAKVEIEGNGLDNGVAFTYDESVSLSGFRLGIGGEYQFTPNIFSKLEYRYSNYNNGDLDIRGANVNLNPIFNGIDVVRHQVAVAVGYRF
jgi:outer membrane immunogenic protein